MDNAAVFIIAVILVLIAGLVPREDKPSRFHW